LIATSRMRANGTTPISKVSVGTIADAARTSACATMIAIFYEAYRKRSDARHVGYDVPHLKHIPVFL
jgi:hypothetical protein